MVCSDIHLPECCSYMLTLSAHRDPGGVVAFSILRCRKITIAAVNGHAVSFSGYIHPCSVLALPVQQAGVGMTAMQLPFDFRFVWEGAKLSFPFVRRGIVPECDLLQLRVLTGSVLTASLFQQWLLGCSRASSDTQTPPPFSSVAKL
jgi:hypothetical protein